MLLVGRAPMIRIATVTLMLFVVGGNSLCSNATGCSCKSKTPKWTIVATCRGLDPKIQLLPLANVTQLTIRSANFTTASSLKILQQFTVLDLVRFQFTHLPIFDWNWLPDSCTRMVLSLSSAKKRPDLAYPPLNGTCNLRSSLNVTKFYISYVPYTQIPACLPDSLETLTLTGVPLSDFQRNQTVTENQFTWPPNLRWLSLKYFTFTHFDADIFDDAPPSLTKISVNACPSPFRRFPSVWPQAGSVVSLYFKHCQVEETQPSDFLYLQKLSYLDLWGNKLTEVPKGLPSSLRTLFLSRNSIRHVEDDVWEALTNLTILALDYNELQSVPRNLPQNLVSLNLRHNAIAFADRNVFSHLKRLRELQLAHNNLLNMPEGLPQTMKYLDLQYNQIALVQSPRNYEYCANCTMQLDYNPWICNENMVQMLLWESQNPVKLVLRQQCGGDPIPSQDLGQVGFEFLKRYLGFMQTSVEFQICDYRIKTLKCVNASLVRFPPKAPNALEYVEISYNDKLTAVPNDLFFSQSKLKTLNLEGNSIQRFPQRLPESLQLLRLNDNQIESISSDESNLLENLKNLKEIHLVNNRIKVLYDYQLIPQKSLRWLALDGNPLVCDCSSYSLTLWYQKLNLNTGQELFLPTCTLPEAYKGYKLREIVGAYRYTLNCVPALCHWSAGSGTLNCSGPTQLKNENTTFIPEMANFTTLPHIPKNSYWLILDLSYLRLQEDDIKLKQLPRLQILDLTDNKLSMIPLKNLPPSLEKLILFRNNIDGISPSLKRYLPKLQLLDLRQNNIKAIESKSLTSLPLVERVLLQGNPIQCDCNLRPLVSYIQAQEKNNITLSNNHFETLKCEKPPKMRGLTLLRLEESEYCEAVIWTEITGGVVGGVCFLLIIAIVVNVILYKRKKLQERKDILLGFHKLLEKEALMNDKDTDSMIGSGGKEYQYDAFISYCSNDPDEEFVYKMIHELEETRERKLCVHERDFTPGQGIADNIVKSIGLSRRVIIVVSRKYAASAWCQYEVQIALAQLHEHRRGRLLVPVLLEDVTQDNDYAGSVKTILSLITGLHVPSPHQPTDVWTSFWDKLEATLPTKASRDNLAYEVD